MAKVLLVVNPSSGGEKAPEFQEMAKEKLGQHFEEVVVKHTEKAGDASAFAKEAARNQFEAVFVMGGDGTVNEGVSGLAEEDSALNLASSHWVLSMIWPEPSTSPWIQ